MLKNHFSPLRKCPALVSLTVCAMLLLPIGIGSASLLNKHDDRERDSTVKPSGTQGGSKRGEGRSKNTQNKKSPPILGSFPCDGGPNTPECQNYWLKMCREEVKRCKAYMNTASMQGEILKTRDKHCTFTYCSNLVDYWKSA